MATSSIRTRPTLQPAGSMMLYRITSVMVKLAWPAANEMTAGAKPASRTAIGSRIHSTGVSVPMPAISAAADDEAGHGAEQRAQHVLAGAERVGPQHRQRAQHDPERVLHPGQVGHQHGQAQGDRAAHAVVQPDRVRLDVGAGPFLHRRQRPASPGRLAAQQLLPPGVVPGRPRSAGCWPRWPRSRSSAPGPGTTAPGRSRTARPTPIPSRPGTWPLVPSRRGPVPAGPVRGAAFQRPAARIEQRRGLVQQVGRGQLDPAHLVADRHPCGR